MLSFSHLFKHLGPVAESFVNVTAHEADLMCDLMHAFFEINWYFLYTSANSLYYAKATHSFSAKI